MRKAGTGHEIKAPRRLQLRWMMELMSGGAETPDQKIGSGALGAWAWLFEGHSAQEEKVQSTECLTVSSSVCS